MRWSRGRTSSCRSMSTSPAAHPAPRPSSMASTSCSGWFRAGQTSAGASATTRSAPRSGRGARPSRPPRRSSEPQRRSRMPDAPGLELIAESINEVREGTVVETSFEHDRAALIVDPEGVIEALRWLRETEGQGYTFLSSLHAADYLPATPRFAVHYELLCRERIERIRVKALLAD